MLSDELFHSLPAKGWLAREEAELLLATAASTHGSILEVGTYHGRSAKLLASLGRVLHCVDPFEGFDSDDPSGEAAYAAFLALELPNVQLHRCRVEDWRARPVGFAYLDGDHTFAGTKAQVRKAMECGPSAVAAHDFSNSSGGVHVRNACLLLLGEPDELKGTLAVWRSVRTAVGAG